MNRAALVSALLALAASPVAVAEQAAPADEAGRKLFEQKCAMCHRSNDMGTGLLARRVDPAVAELEKRNDLTIAFVTNAARFGILNMPRITRGDVSDEQMALIASYLAKGKP